MWVIKLSRCIRVFIGLLAVVIIAVSVMEFLPLLPYSFVVFAVCYYHACLAFDVYYRRNHYHAIHHFALPFAWMGVGMINVYVLCSAHGHCEPRHLMLPLFNGTITVLAGVAAYTYGDGLVAREAEIDSVLNHEEE
jgi:hypothetical protein